MSAACNALCLHHLRAIAPQLLKQKGPHTPSLPLPVQNYFQAPMMCPGQPGEGKSPSEAAKWSLWGIELGRSGSCQEELLGRMDGQSFFLLWALIHSVADRQTLLLQAGTAHPCSIPGSPVFCSLYQCVPCGQRVRLDPQVSHPDPESCPAPDSQMLGALPQHQTET